jgi:hypothetical protein
MALLHGPLREKGSWPAVSKAPGRLLQRKCACSQTGQSCERCAADTTLHRRSTGVNGPALGFAPPIVREVLVSPGRPLDRGVLNMMEPHFGRDFSDVRVHTDAQAAASAKAVDALAYTVGNDVVFAEGRMAPHSASGRELLAHELAHVTQDRGDSGSDIRMGIPGDASEKAADDAARRVATREPVTMPRPTTASLRRKPDSSLPIADWFEVRGGTVFVEGTPIATIGLGQGARLESGSYSMSARRHASVRGNYATRLALNEANIAHLHKKGYRISTFDQGERGVSLTVDRQAPGAVETVATANSNDAHPWVSSSPNASTSQPAQAGVAPPPPARSAKQLIDEHTHYLNLDEARLGATLLGYAKSGQIDTVLATFDELGSTDRDDVAVTLIGAATQSDLEALSASAPGSKLLLRLYDEATSGEALEDEIKAADRVQRAIAQRIDPKRLIEAPQKAPILPFSSIGWTKFSSASLSVHRLPNGNIWVRSHMTNEHWKDAKRIPTVAITYGGGIEMAPTDLIGLYQYDEGGKIIYVPALHLLKLSNQETTKAGHMMGEAVLTGLTLGMGGEAVAGGEAAAATWTARGLSVLKWADRAATAVSIASTLINDHRGLIIKHFGKDGETFLEHWGTVERVVAIYGLGRGAMALGQTAFAVRASYSKWRAAQAELKNLTAEERRALDSVAAQTEKSLAEIESSKRATVRSIAPEGVSEETVAMLAEKPELLAALAKNPRAARALTLCNSPCIPDFATTQQVARIEELLKEAEGARLAFDPQRLKEYFHETKNAASLEEAIHELETAWSKPLAAPRGKPVDFSKVTDKQVDNALEQMRPAGDLVELGAHHDATKNRKILGVSGQDVQSAHVMPQAIGRRGIPGYNPDASLSRLMQTGLHQGMDRSWNDSFKAMRRAGRTRGSAQEIFDTVADSIGRAPGLPAGEKASLIERLKAEMFMEYGLRPGDMLPLPHPNIPAD